MEEKLHAIGIQKIGDLAKLDDRDLENRFGKWAWRWPESHAVKTQELVRQRSRRKRRPEINQPRAHVRRGHSDAERLQSTLMRLSEMVEGAARSGYFARTLQLKLRYKDFTTITRAHSSTSRRRWITTSSSKRDVCFSQLEAGAPVRLLGVQASNFESGPGQLDLLEPKRDERWKSALAAATICATNLAKRQSVSPEA